MALCGTQTPMFFSSGLTIQHPGSGAEQLTTLGQRLTIRGEAGWAEVTLPQRYAISAVGLKPSVVPGCGATTWRFPLRWPVLA